MKNESDVVEWFCANGALINPIVAEMTYAKEKLLELEPVVFHDDIIEEFNDLVIQKITDLVTKDLAIPAELVYNTIKNKKSLIKALERGLE